MEALNIRQLASEMTTSATRHKAGPSQRGLRKKEKKAKEPVVLRRSGRRTGAAAELSGGIDQREERWVHRVSGWEDDYARFR